MKALIQSRYWQGAAKIFRTLRSYLIELIVVTGGLLLSLTAAYRSYEAEVDASLSRLHTDVAKYGNYLTEESGNAAATVKTLVSLFEQVDVGHHMFESISQNALIEYRHLYGLSWVPAVPAAEREEFETQIRRLDPQFAIRWIENQNLIAAGRADYYLPTLWQVYRQGGHTASGIDWLSGDMGEDLLRVIDGEEQSFIIAMQQSLSMVLQGVRDAEYYMVLAHPVYDKSQRSVGATRPLKGFLVATVRVQSLLRGFVKDEHHRFINLVLTDESKNDQTYFLAQIDGGDLSEELDQFNISVDINALGDRRWRFDATPTKNYIDYWLSGEFWYLLLVGLTVTGSTAGYIYLLRSRSDVVNRLVQRRTEQLGEANRKLGYLVRVDPLTGVSNRRFLEERLNSEWLRAMRDRLPLSVMMFDVDCFKQYNDRYGHDQGDVCLQAVATALRGCFARPGDVFARYGGEEFAAVLPNTSQGLDALLLKCMRAVASLKLPHGGSDVGTIVSVSIGLCTMTPNLGQEVGDLMKAADKALYDAKGAGRDRGVINKNGRMQVVEHEPGDYLDLSLVAKLPKI